MGKKRTWTEEDLREAVRSNLSIAGVLRDLGLRPLGGNYGTINRYVDKLDLDTSHWTGQGWLKDSNTRTTTPIPLSSILVVNSSYTSSSHLKKRLIDADLLKEICYICKLAPIWNNLPLTLHLDHINGIKNDNRLENLRLLCPNCHSQTPTYCNRK